MIRQVWRPLLRPSGVTALNLDPGTCCVHAMLSDVLQDLVRRHLAGIVPYCDPSNRWKILNLNEITLLLTESVLVLIAFQLNASEIVIELGGPTTVVEARYEIGEPFDSLALNIIRLPGQEVHLLSADMTDTIESETLTGLYRLILTPMSGSGTTAYIRYEVTGNLSRIPLAVPEIPTGPGARSVRIKLRGLNTQAALAEGFPRFEPRTDGTAVAELDNVPGLVRLPPDQGQWSVNRISEIVVVLLVVLASSFWLIRQRQQHAQSQSGSQR